MTVNAWIPIGRTLLRTPRTALALTALMAMTAVVASPAHAQDAGESARLKAEITRIKADIQKAEADIRRTDSLAGVEQEAAERASERLTRDRQRREKENTALTARVRDARERAASERARGEGYEDGVAEIHAREESLSAFFVTVADTLLTRVETGLPWDKDERRDRILSLKRDIEGGNAAPDEALSRLVALLREETKAGDEVVLSSRPLTRKSGEVVNAQVMKIGNQTAVYVDEDGKKYGILEPVERDGAVAWIWREELGLSERSAVKRAVAVKAGREAPQLTPLPVTLSGLAAAAADTAASATKGGR